MVLLTNRLQTPETMARLTLQTQKMGRDTTTIRCLDWDRDRFDIEFELQNGTTYNSFLIQGERTALVDTSHAKFCDLYLEALQNLIDPSQLDYLIISHTEPDHSGLVADILAIAPHITIVGAKIAIQFLQNMVHQPFQSRVVKNDDRLDLGNGHELEFVLAPNLHWPDTIFTYDHSTQILFTCDAFGMHYCDEQVYDETPHLVETDFRYYYDCLMGPNARSVLKALKRIDPLPLQMVATGHGPLLQHHVEDWIGRYRQWSLDQAKTDNLVALFYVEGYGYGDQLVRAIAHGLTKTGADLEVVDLTTADPHEVRELATSAIGLVIGMPPQGEQHFDIQVALSTVLASAHKKQTIGLFETGGGEDEPIYPLRTHFQDLGLRESFAPILVKSQPNSVLLKLCEEAGTDLGQWVTRDRAIQKMKAMDSSLERALGRLSSGLYIITTQQGDVSSAMLASWVMQASSEPPGVVMAVAHDRAIESLLQVGDRFVLNVLEEGNSQHLVKHFLKQFAPGANRFAGVRTCPSRQGDPILAEALAYLECEVISRTEGGDHWMIYGTVHAGRVSKADGLTAVHHRKVGNHY
ncbi:MAG: MBL fold metallo-hydrolase [Cyanothece sp. SIO2G6]|nr:MBL fold metallo-hydrolase [Cyanothece sp. SIO2G6]